MLHSIINVTNMKEKKMLKDKRRVEIKLSGKKKNKSVDRILEEYILNLLSNYKYALTCKKQLNSTLDFVI